MKFGTESNSQVRIVQVYRTSFSLQHLVLITATTLTTTDANEFHAPSKKYTSFKPKTLPPNRCTALPPTYFGGLFFGGGHFLEKV